MTKREQVEKAEAQVAYWEREVAYWDREVAYWDREARKMRTRSARQACRAHAADAAHRLAVLRGEAAPAKLAHDRAAADALFGARR